MLFTAQMYLLLALIGATHCHELGIVSDRSLEKLRDMTNEFTLSKEQVLIVSETIRKSGLPNAVQCTGFEKVLGAGQ